MTLSPHEELDGNPEATAELLGRLTELRSTPHLHRDHPGILFVTLADALALNLVDRGVFVAGWQELARRYNELGVGRLLPLERVWYGVRATPGPAFGGFHHPDQGYRHLQQIAIFTAYGDLTQAAPACPRLAALDLLRSFGHDCLHWASYRVYTLRTTERGGEISRIRYGINARTVDGRTYSARDQKTSRTTRNLGVVMEGATDREAHRIARAAAERLDVAVHDSASVDYFAYLDETGGLVEADVRILSDRSLRAQIANDPGAEEYLKNMGSYARGVGTRYATFLDEFGAGRDEQLHEVIVRCMISGQLEPLSAWLADRHGPNSFERIFKTEDFEIQPA